MSRWQRELHTDTGQSNSKQAGAAIRNASLLRTSSRATKPAATRQGKEAWHSALAWPGAHLVQDFAVVAAQRAKQRAVAIHHDKPVPAVEGGEGARG